jgi:hypothetical protein
VKEGRVLLCWWFEEDEGGGLFFLVLRGFGPLVSGQLGEVRSTLYKRSAASSLKFHPAPKKKEKPECNLVLAITPPMPVFPARMPVFSK